MGWGSPDHDHPDLYSQIQELRDELYRVRSELADYIRTETDGLRERMNEVDA